MRVGRGHGARRVGRQGVRRGRAPPRAEPTGAGRMSPSGAVVYSCESGVNSESLYARVAVMKASTKASVSAPLASRTITRAPISCRATSSCPRPKPSRRPGENEWLQPAAEGSNQRQRPATRPPVRWVWIAHHSVSGEATRRALATVAAHAAAASGARTRERPARAAAGGLARRSRRGERTGLRRALALRVVGGQRGKAHIRLGHELLLRRARGAQRTLVCAGTERSSDGMSGQVACAAATAEVCVVGRRTALGSRGGGGQKARPFILGGTTYSRTNASCSCPLARLTSTCQTGASMPAG